MSGFSVLLLDWPSLVIFSVSQLMLELVMALFEASKTKPYDIKYHKCLDLLLTV